jgi:hypothetical protein
MAAGAPAISCLKDLSKYRIRFAPIRAASRLFPIGDRAGGLKPLLQFLRPPADRIPYDDPGPF